MCYTFFDYTQEQLEKEAHMSPEEMLKLAQENGVELTDEQLQSVAGGQDWDEIEASSVRCGIFGRRTYYYKSEGLPKYCQYCGTIYA